MADPEKKKEETKPDEFYYQSRIGATPTRVDPSQGLTSDKWLDSGVWANGISSTVAAFRYDRKFRELYVRFVSGATYRYSQVPGHIAEGMFLAASLGKYHAQNIKKKFSFRKL